jgi:hypothetical protein
MKLLQSAVRTLALLALAGAAHATQPPCTDDDFEKFSLYDAAAMNTRISPQELRNIFSKQFNVEVGALNHLHARCNYALSARFTTQDDWNVFYRESLGKLKAFCTKDMSPPYCEEAMSAEVPRTEDPR